MFLRWILGIAATAAALALPASVSAANLASTFDTGDEGWRVIGNHPVNPSVEEAPAFVPDGGNPGGFIRVTDAKEPFNWEALSPSPWRGDMRANYGGTLSADVRHANPDYGMSFSILSIHGTLFYSFADKPGGWESHSVPLTEADACWTLLGGSQSGARVPTKEEFLAVLSDVHAFGVEVDLAHGTGDVGEIDNVRLSETPSAKTHGCVPADSDGDGVADEIDSCPAVPGPVNAGGCPVTGPPSFPPGLDPACIAAQEKLDKAKDKLKEAGDKKAKEKARAKVKRAKERVKEICGA
jgi:hypothetical protein